MSEIRPELHLWVAYLEKKEELEEAQDRIAELEAALRDVLPYVDTCNSSHREAQAKGYAALEGRKDEAPPSP